MIFHGFAQEDFDVFAVQGLEPRMGAIIEQIRPKLAAIGAALEPHLSLICGEPMYTHVAKHARRTVHPPNDTWVAWAGNRRGYKAHPHFQVGLWQSHLFAQFAVIYESTNKAVFAERMARSLDDIRRIVPGHYIWSSDHTKPEAARLDAMSDKDLLQFADKLKHVKKAEALCGIHVDRDDPVLQDGGKLLALFEQTFETLQPLYRMAF
jgi:uncharacterized protein YktB (UPF0637 family)